MFSMFLLEIKTNNTESIVRSMVNLSGIIPYSKSIKKIAINKSTTRYRVKIKGKLVPPCKKRSPTEITPVKSSTRKILMGIFLLQNLHFPLNKI